MKAAVAPTQQLIERLLEGSASSARSLLTGTLMQSKWITSSPAHAAVKMTRTDAATHEWCNRTKSDADLRVARSLAKYEQIKDKRAAEGPKRPNLGDFLNEFGGGKFYPSVSDKVLTVSLPETPVIQCVDLLN